MNRTHFANLVALCVLFLCTTSASGQTATAGLMRLLKSGKIPAERQPQIIEMVCERGGAEDLAYIFEQATSPDGFRAEVRSRALEALAETAVTRKVKPTGDLTLLEKLIDSQDADSASLRLLAIRLVGLWKVEKLSPKLEAYILASNSEESLRTTSLDALTAMGDKVARATIDKLIAKGQPQKLRYLGIAALAKIKLDDAAIQAANVLADGTDRDDPVTLISAFFDQKNGPQKLTAALRAKQPPRDIARLLLRGMYAIGRNDQPLADLLQNTAGILAEVHAVTGDDLAKMVAEVSAKGDAARGEQVFRRADLSCLKCHAISKAGGDIGPDLSAVGSISPADYIINSIMVPALAVKENFIMTTVVTNDGRVLQGIVTEKNNQRWILKDATGKLTSIAKEDIDEEETKEGGSLMPKGLSNLMTNGEFLDLVRFISELGKPGPYAIRTQSMIQRWRVLKEVPVDLATSPPDDAKFKKSVLGASEDVWQSAYGKVSGDLPLADVVQPNAKVVYLYGEIDVTAAGELEVAINAPAKSHVWFNDKSFGERTKFKLKTDTGVSKITLRVTADAPTAESVKVEFTKPANSTVEFTVVGGR